MSDYYTKTEMEALYSQKLCLNNLEVETYIMKPSPSWRGVWSITFQRSFAGVVMISLHLQTLNASYPAGYVDLVVGEDFPRKFRPSMNMFFMCADKNNKSRCVGILKEGTIRIYNSVNEGCYGVITYIGNQFSDYSLQTYFKQPAYDAVTYINQFGPEWSSFVCVADTHGRLNQGHSQSIMRYVLENSKAEMGFWLGDTIAERWTGYTKEQYLESAEEYLCNSNQIYMVYGNHDRKDTVLSGSAGLNMDMFGDFLCDKYEAVKNSYHLAFGNIGPDGNVNEKIDNLILDWLMQYFYFIDDFNSHTRYMVINTSQEGKFTLNDSQLEWIQYCVHFGVGYENWNLVVFGHIDIDNNPTLIDRDDENIAQIRNAIGSSNGRIVGYFCGHQHIDHFSFIPSSITMGQRIPQMMFACDKNTYGEGQYPEFDYPVNRDAGTVNEQAVTIVSFNRNNGRVLLRRIGAVTPNMTTEYNYLSAN